MNRRTKHKIILAAWLSLFLFLGFGVWNFQAGHLMILVYCILSAIVYTVYAFSARCRQCGLPILLKPVKIGRIEIYGWSVLAPDRCRHCGAALQ